MHESSSEYKLRVELSERGSVITEYLVVMAGLLIVWAGIEAVLALMRLHNERYSATLELLF